MTMWKHDSPRTVHRDWILLIAVLVSAPAWADSETVPAQSPSDQAIERFIRSHPEVIEQALKSLDVRRQKDQKARVRQAIEEYQNELLRDLDSPVSGNLSRDVTVIEFFDYRCGYCKDAAKSVTQLTCPL